MQIRMKVLAAVCWAFLLVQPCLEPARGAQPRVIDAQLHDLRSAEPREWSEFPAEAEGDRLEVRFEAHANDADKALQLRQQDLKQTWTVSLNGHALGGLVRDENDMLVYFTIPAGGLRTGENRLLVEPTGRGVTTPDDIRVGEVALHDRPLAEVLAEATLEVRVTDADSGEPLPCRLTILNHRGALQTVGVESDDHLAVRPGVVYTSTGAATIPVPAGEYTLYAGRGFEYSLASTTVSAAAGATKQIEFTIRREVPTEGYVACDTHVHTLTFSKHGDASIEERMITLAGEGVELPIATDHNVQIDYEPFARKLNVRRYFTPVVGNEVTTRTGHFNIFPAPAGGPPPDFRHDEWRKTFDSIADKTAARVIILNHARDLHSGTRPFGPEHYNEAVGENLDGWQWGANAMEVINSGATQTDATQLLRDWMTQLNRGRRVTPVGCSDSHDVARHFVGQGRTYIRCDDADVSRLDVDRAIDNFLAGRVMVSYGLLAEMEVDGKFRHGDLASCDGDWVHVRTRVLGPHWVSADKVQLLANGKPIHEWRLSKPSPGRPERGVVWQGEFTMPAPQHDVFLTVIASGPGIAGLYWPTAKAYQPTSPDWTPRVLACSGAVWLDGDGDGRRSAACDYARRAFEAAGGDVPKLFAALADYDEATAAQAAGLLETAGTSILSPEVRSALDGAAPAVQTGFRNYREAWRKNQTARAGR